MPDVFGFIKENNVPVSKTVFAYDQITGELVATTTSSASDGYFSITLLTTDLVFLVASPLPNVNYNSLIEEKIEPLIL